MDKYEYKVHSEKISNLIDMERYAEALAVADTIDWRRVKSVNMLLKIAALYRINRRNEHSREILMLAYDRYPTNRSVVYSLCELSIELDDVVAAIEYYKQFVKLAPKDIGVFTLRYRILETQEASLEERIAILEELKKRDYQEEWAYELAYQYHRMGLATRCVEECDDIILWFGDGSYVVKAMELKALHSPLSAAQLERYNALVGRAQNNYSIDYGNEDGYQPDGGGNESFEDGDYPEGEYQSEEYTYGEYADENYGQYGGEPYGDAAYTQNGYIDDGYGNLGGLQNSNSYTGEFYVKQVYDENGNPVPVADYGNEGYYGESGGNYNDEGYCDGSGGYDDVSYVQQSNITPAPFTGVGDMSQYNTINLQKVVAEGMKEVFPNGYDVFAEDREKFNPTMASDDGAGDTRIFSKDSVNRVAAGKGENAASGADILSPEVPGPRVQTGRMAQLVNGVSEEAPEPDTGAIKKVLVPGSDARPIKAESDIEELRDITEPEAPEATPGPTTGSVKLDGALVEWERMKQDNAKKCQEEIKKHIRTQTGRILANFDNSVNSDILNELERDGKGQPEEAGGTPDEGRVQASDDEFDVAYVSDESGVVNVVTKAFGDENAVPEKTQAQIKEEYVTELKRVVAQQLEGTAETEYHAETDGTREYRAEETEVEAPEYREKEIEPETAEYYGEETENETSEYYEEEIEGENQEYYEEEAENETSEYYEEEAEPETSEYYEEEIEGENQEYYEEEAENEASEYYEEEIEGENQEYYEEEAGNETSEYYEEEIEGENQEYYEEEDGNETSEYYEEEIEGESQEYYGEDMLDPEEEESIAEMAKEDALKTQEIKMNTGELSSLSEKIVETTNKEAAGAKREEIRKFTPEEQMLFDNFAVTTKIRKQIIYALDNMTLSAYTGNVIITGDAGIDTVRMARNLLKEYQACDANFSGRLAKISGEAFNRRNVREVFEKLDAGGIIIEKANGMTEETLYEMAINLNQESIGIVVIMEDTKKEITKLLEKQAMIADYFNIRIDLMEMNNDALVAYAKNYALALEYSIDELGTLALYTRIANMQSGNHVVTKDEVRDIIDEAIWKSKKSKVKNLVDVLFARKYDNEDMIVLRERDFM